MEDLRFTGMLAYAGGYRDAALAQPNAHLRRWLSGSIVWVVALLTVLLPVSSGAQVSVLTYHNDVARTGQNLNETILTPANVNQTGFGKLYSYSVDGWVVGQPLYLQNVAIPGLGSHNVVFVTTMHDSVYAFDADSANGDAPLWQASLIDPANGITSVPAADGSCVNVTKFTELGITGTPAIDPVSGTIYFVARTKENGSYFQRLHALDITTGQERIGSPVTITATFPGTGDGTDVVTFDPLGQASRAAVLLNNGTVFLGFADNGCKQVHNHGWVLAYDAISLQQVGVFNTTPNDNNGGIWQSGSGPAADSNGNIYVETADALFDANTGGPDYGDSILKLTFGTNGLALSDYFTPVNQGIYNTNDQDLASVGPLVLPDQGGPFPHLLIGSGKDETVYLLNRDNMGGFNSVQDQIVQELPPLYTRLRGQVPTYWNGFVYFEQFFSPVVGYSITDGVLSTAPVTQTTTSYQRNGPSSISANGTQNGILWLLTTGNANPTLRAYDPTNLATEFYDSDQAGSRDTVSLAAHFALPMVANGKVYVGKQTEFLTYGLLGVAPTATPSPSSISFSDQTISTTSDPQVVTLTNSGSAPLVVNTVTVTGDFAQTNTCKTNVAEGSTCAISVTFTPTAVGARSGSISVIDNAGDSPQTVSLSGNGVSGAAPAVSLSPGALTFANQTVGTTSAAQAVMLTNTGNAALTISSISVGGANFLDFSQTNTCGASLAAGANCAITVTFTPTDVGSRSASISIVDNAAGNPHAVPLSGTGVSPSVSIAPASLTFATQLINTASNVQTITVTNTGAGTLIVSSISLSGTNPGDFSQTNTCGNVAPGGNCTVTVKFQPLALGKRTASVSIVDNAVGSPQAVSLTGTGTVIQLSPSALNFGTVLLGTSSAQFTSTMTNLGSTTVNITNITLTGTFPGDYVQTNTCGHSILAGTTCTITVTFTPLAIGARNAAVSVADNGGGTFQKVTLTGTATQVSVSPPVLAFGSQAVRTASAPQSVNLTNVGATPLSILAAIAVKGANPRDFTQTNTCGTTIAAGASCTITVTFKPTLTGIRNALIWISDNGGASPQTVSVSGTGI